MPVNGTLIDADELRAQLNGLKTELDTKVNSGGIGVLIGQYASANTNPLQPLSQSISNPPTQAQVQALQAKVNELINALKTPEA